MYREYGLISEPDVSDVKLKRGDVIVLASDGLWDAVTAEQIKTIRTLPAEDIAIECLNTAIEKESTDNTTIIALKF